MSDENTVDEEPEDTEIEQDDAAESDDPDSEDGDSDDKPEDGESGEESTKDKDEPVDIEAITRRADEATRRSDDDRNLLLKVLAGQGKDPQEEARKERERVAAMSPEERALHIVENGKRQIEYITQQSEFRVKDANDRASFQILCAKNPAAAKLADVVEKRLAEERAKGYNFDRTVLLKYEMGERALKSAEKGGSRKQKREASENVRKSGTSATKASGDRGRSGRPDANSREARLERLRDARF